MGEEVEDVWDGNYVGSFGLDVVVCCRFKAFDTLLL